MIRTHSPEGTAAADRNKRRRKVLSCYDCRRRKLQCDRAMPACGRCVKAGNVQNCLYLDEPGESTSTRPDEEALKTSDVRHSAQHLGSNTSADLVEKLEYQDRRIRQLESALLEADRRNQLSEPLLRARVANSRLPPTPESIIGNASLGIPPEDGGNVNDRDTMLLRGRSFKTQFLGSTHPCSLIAHLPGLNEFTREAFENFPALSRVRTEMKQLDNRTDYAGSRSSFVSDQDLRVLLPSRQELDRHVQLYFDNYGILYSVIHVPSFMTEYEAMWQDLEEAKPSFVALVLLVSATAQCLNTSEPWLFTANSSAAREAAVKYIQACEDWLRNQSQKRVTITYFQTRFLIVLGKQVSARKYKRTWTECGELLRYCMCAGLHRNPELIRKTTSPCDAEFRRRIWAAVVELELQASLDRGMVPQNWLLQSDTTGPSNFADEQFDESTETNPHPKPIQQFTNSSYLVLAHESTATRHYLTTSLNNIRQVRSFDEVKRATDEIQAHVDNIPEWKDSRGQLASAKLSLLLRQYLLVLHDRYIRQAESSSERNFSAMLLVDCATRIVQTHRSLLNQNCHALQLLCQDQVRAALSLSHVGVIVDPKSDLGLKQIIDDRGPALVSDVVEMLTEKVNRFGREQRQLWIALASFSWWKSKKEPSRRAEFMQEALDRVIRPYFRIMACQTGPVFASVEKDGDSTSKFQGYLDYMPAVNDEQISIEQPSLDVQDPIALDFDQIAAWTFDDWAFNNIEF